MRGWEVLPYGRDAALVECAPGTAVALAQALQRAGGFLEVVPAERSVLVRLARGNTVHDLRSLLTTLPDVLPLPEGRDIEVPVRYDGADLDQVARTVDLTTAEVVALHTGVTYDASFAGFAPGYVYCTGLDSRLHLPRRPSPRTRVPAGSVAIADIYTAVYPTASPGGWHLLGTTDLPLFDLTRTEPALIRPGDRVRFTVRTA